MKFDEHDTIGALSQSRRLRIKPRMNVKFERVWNKIENFAKNSVIVRQWESKKIRIAWRDKRKVGESLMKIHSLEKILFLRYRRTVRAEKNVLVSPDGWKFDKNLRDRKFHLKSKRGCVFMHVLAITTSVRYVCISSTTLTDADASRRDVCDFIVPRYSTTERLGDVPASAFMQLHVSYL